MKTKPPAVTEDTFTYVRRPRIQANRRAGPARPRGNADHEFGTNATELKLGLVEAYSRAYTRALRGKFAELLYFDAFAGTGERTERVPAERILNTEISPEDH